MCCSKVSHSVSVIQSTDQDAFIGVVQDSEHKTPWVYYSGSEWETPEIQGADVSVIPHKVFKSIPGTSLKPAKKILSSQGRKVLPVKGQFIATLWRGGREVTWDLFVV